MCSVFVDTLDRPVQVSSIYYGGDTNVKVSTRETGYSAKLVYIRAGA